MEHARAGTDWNLLGHVERAAKVNNVRRYYLRSCAQTSISGALSG